MQKKYFYLFVLSVFFVLPISVNASSISYNLNIDKNLEFSEDIEYKVKKSELDNTGDFDFLTSIVNDSVYFDNDSSVKYKKTKSYANGEYTIHLNNNYSYIFLANSRILHECFSDFTYDINDSDSISIRTTSPFYCNHRANNITINITTPLKVTSSNSNSINGNTYTWNNIDSDFSLNLKMLTASSESATTPLDDDTDNNNNDNNNNNTTNNTSSENDNKNNDNNEKKSSFSFTTFIIILSIIIFLSLIIALVLKSKNNKVNKL